MTGPLARLARFAHPRLVLLVLVGVALGLVGLVLVLTAGPTGHGLRLVGLRLAGLGGLVFAFGGSGLVAFFVFERGFD